MQTELGRAAFTVIPSVCFENGPMAGLESLAAGSPLAGTPMGGIPEMIRDGETGVVFASTEPEDILAGLLRARDLDPDAGRSARAWAEAHADRTAHMDRLAGILGKLAG